MNSKPETIIGMRNRSRRWIYVGIIAGIPAALLLAGLAVLSIEAASAQSDPWARQFATSFEEDANGVTMDDAGNI